jgi:tartrate dehydrogenase/decarboxylase/D-malate dehydrogenase
MSAIETVTADKANHCQDLGGTATTRLVTEAVIAAMKDDPNPTAPASSIQEAGAIAC